MDPTAVAVYAYGSGRGHATRAALVLAALGHEPDPALVLRGPDPERALEHLARRAPRHLVVDAFPCGLTGELTASTMAAAGVVPDRITLVARLLDWHAYAPLIAVDPPRYDDVLLAEALSGDHEAWCRANASEVQALRLPPAGPAARGAAGPAAARVSASRREGRQVWAVVHSGPPVEVAELVDVAHRHASDLDPPPVILAVTPPDNWPLLPGLRAELVDLSPAASLYPFLDRIVTAGGWNTMRETAPFRDRHFAIPFPRRFDDQHTRIARAFGSGGVGEHQPTRSPPR